MNWLLDFCHTHNLLSESQFSFRPVYSTESALITSTNEWFTQLDKGYSICATFFNQTKAPHQPLLDVLSSLDIPHHLIVWLQSYITLQSQQVVMDGCSSSKSSVLSGVRQGSILGPLLFILYVNDIFQLPFSSTSSMILYADDILLSCPFKSFLEFPLTQSNINILSSWVKSKHLTINHSKTKYMIISRKSPTSFTTLPSLFLDGSPLELVSSFKYLGVTSHPLNLNLPFSRSSATLNSFLPSTISLWNSLPSSLKDLNSASQFKQNISYLL